MNIQVRAAKLQDYDAVIELFGDFVENPERYKDKNSESFDEVLKNPNSFIYVAEEDNALVGFVTFSRRHVIRYGSPIVEVEEFYVVPSLRRKGIGKKLKQTVLDYAKEHNCEYIFLASSKDREAAHKFYKALDFDEYAFHFRRKP